MRQEESLSINLNKLADSSAVRPAVRVCTSAMYNKTKSSSDNLLYVFLQITIIAQVLSIAGIEKNGSYTVILSNILITYVLTLLRFVITERGCL